MKILIVKTSALGDLVQVFPAIGYLKNRYPDCSIDWVVESPFSSLIKAHPDIQRTFLVRTKQWRKQPWSMDTWRGIWEARSGLRQTNYDIAFDLQGNVKSGLILSQVSAKDKVGFAKDSVPEWPNLLFTNRKYDLPCRSSIRADYLSVLKQYFQDRQPYESSRVFLQTTSEEHAQVDEILLHPCLQNPTRVLVACGSAWPNKELPLKTLQEVLQGVQQRLQCSFLFSFGSEDERQKANVLAECFPDSSVIVPKLSLPALQALMHRLQLVMAMDSLPLHLAGTTSTPVFGFFGPSSAAKYKPVGSGAFQGTCPYKHTFEKRCPHLRTCPTGACLRQSSAQLLLHSFFTWWDGLDK